jgi:hypothetical protein
MSAQGAVRDALACGNLSHGDEKSPRRARSAAKSSLTGGVRDGIANAVSDYDHGSADDGCCRP